VAGSTFNIFNNHAARVKMANIAQTINVLQAMILTDKEKMILTPTYHVFEMYTVHHDATLLPSKVETAEYAFAGEKIPAVNVSASRDKAAKIHVTLCNLNPNGAAEVSLELQGATASKLSGRALTSAQMTAHNTFEKPDEVHPTEFNAISGSGNGFTATLPPKSVVVLALE
jgi:alpha-N-arabinofuranosidase